MVKFNYSKIVNMLENKDKIIHSDSSVKLTLRLNNQILPNAHPADFFLLFLFE